MIKNLTASTDRFRCILNTNEDLLSNSESRPCSIRSSFSSIGLERLKINEVDPSLNVNPGIFLWTPKISTKYFLFGMKPRRICRFRKPVHAKAVPRFESVKINVNWSVCPENGVGFTYQYRVSDRLVEWNNYSAPSNVNKTILAIVQ